MWDLNRQITVQQDKNSGLKARNETLDAEVRDLKSGRAAIEERARSELGMIKQDEVFYQVMDQPLATQPVNQMPSATDVTPAKSSDKKVNITPTP